MEHLQLLVMLIWSFIVQCSARTPNEEDLENTNNDHFINNLNTRCGCFFVRFRVCNKATQANEQANEQTTR